MKTENIIKSINAIPRGAALCDHSAYMNHEATEEDGSVMFVDILAWRTRSQNDEDARWHDTQALLYAIESLPEVRDIEQVGDIDHENGRGWTYEVTLAAPLCPHCAGSTSATALMTGCTCGVSDAEFNEMWSAIAD